MTEEQIKCKKTLKINNIIFFILLLFDLPLSVFSLILFPFLFDDPSTGVFTVLLFLLAILSYPLVYLISIKLSKKYYKEGNYKKALHFANLPWINASALLILLHAWTSK